MTSRFSWRRGEKGFAPLRRLRPAVRFPRDTVVLVIVAVVVVVVVVVGIIEDERERRQREGGGGTEGEPLARLCVQG